MEKRSKFSDEELYAMLSIADHTPNGGHGGETFWLSTLRAGLFKAGRSSSTLRGKWRGIVSEVSIICGT